MPRRKASETVSLESHIDALQKLGYKVQAPTTHEEEAKQEASMELLGFAESPGRKRKAKREPLTGHLQCQHYVAGRVYGPGLLKLAPGDEALFQSLLRQDQDAVRAAQDTPEYGPSRCYMILPGRGRDQHSRHAKVEVSEQTFGSTAFLDNIMTRVTGQEGQQWANAHPMEAQRWATQVAQVATLSAQYNPPRRP